MVRQDFPIPSSTTATLAARSSRRAGTTNKRAKEPTHIWEVRHAGLLGIKYEVAVRPDLVSEPVKDDSGLVSQAALQDVVDAAILGRVRLLCMNELFFDTFIG
jgi:TATA-binding protein-associated factor